MISRRPAGQLEARDALGVSGFATSGKSCLANRPAGRPLLELR